MSRILGAVLPLLVLAVSACGQDSGLTPGDADRGWPQGRTFLSTSVTEQGRDRPLRPNTRIRLNFGPDGQIGAHAGCNQMGGDGTLVDGKLVIGPMSQTEMGCEPALMEQDTWLSSFLGSKPAWSLSGDELTLTSGAVQLVLTDRRIVDPDQPLANTDWVVDTVISGETASTVPPGPAAKLTFDGTGGFTGFTGCADVSGTAVVVGNTVTIAVATPPACTDPDRRQLHEAVLATLTANVTYRIEAKRLTLTATTGNGVSLTTGG